MPGLLRCCPWQAEVWFVSTHPLLLGPGEGTRNTGCLSPSRWTELLGKVTCSLFALCCQVSDTPDFGPTAWHLHTPGLSMCGLQRCPRGSRWQPLRSCQSSSGVSPVRNNLGCGFLKLDLVSCLLSKLRGRTAVCPLLSPF